VNGEDFIALLPLLIVAATAILVMLAVAVRRSHTLSASLTFLGLGAAFGSLWVAIAAAPRQVTPLLVLDDYAFFYMGLIAAASMAFVLLSYSYFEKLEGDREELYILMLVATLGSMVLVASSHFVSLFLGLELLSVPLYGMIAYPYYRALPLEAGIKYLVLAAVSAAFLVFGMALIYGALGTMQFDAIATWLARPGFDGWMVLPGMTLIITGFGFKLAVVPFHLWTPDVYQGAPAPVAAYIATVSKGAMFALLLRYFYRSGAHNLGPIFLLFAIIAIASMFIGNILALLQTNVKRILAYSSIAHLGYLLVAFQASGILGPTAVTFYLVAYFVTTLGAFGVVGILSDGTREADSLEDYRGLFWRRPVLAAVFTAMLLSLAGIPVTAGFIGKFYILAAATSVAMWPQVVILVVTSAIGLYYYLRIVIAIYDSPVSETPYPQPSLAVSGAVVLAVLTGCLVLFGLFPQTLLGIIRQAVSGTI
jgi:NADH-quinone oxidoreductase subunit N